MTLCPYCQKMPLFNKNKERFTKTCGNLECQKEDRRKYARDTHHLRYIKKGTIDKYCLNCKKPFKARRLLDLLCGSKECKRLYQIKKSKENYHKKKILKPVKVIKCLYCKKILYTNNKLHKICTEKECVSKYMIDYRIKKGEELLKKKREYWRRPEVQKRRKEYYLKTQQKRKEYNKNYREQNPEYFKEARVKDKERHSILCPSCKKRKIYKRKDFRGRIIGNKSNFCVECKTVYNIRMLPISLYESNFEIII